LQDIRFRIAPDTITAITPLQNAVSLADSTAKYTIRTTRNDLILIISNEVSPLAVKRAADRQKETRALLHGHTAEPIELPVFEGFTAEKSYAVWLKRRPLSSNRIRSKVERMLLAPRVYGWLRDLASQTATSANLRKILANTRRLQEAPAIPASIKTAAETSYNEFRSGKITPIQVAQHGDLWTGNILKAPSKTGFIVIDWGGAKIDGAPFFDLITFALSVGASRSVLRREIASHCKVLGCNPRDALAYVLSGLGALHSELEHFPEGRFLDLCKQNFYALQSTIN
jgi:hypothetical protein